LRGGGGGPWARFSFLELWLFLFLLFSLLQQNKGKILSKSNKQKWKFSIVSGFSSSFFFLCLLSSAGNKQKMVASNFFSPVGIMFDCHWDSYNWRTHAPRNNKKNNKLIFFSLRYFIVSRPPLPFRDILLQMRKKRGPWKTKKFGRLKETVCCFFYCSVQKAQHSRLERNQTEFK
jgi:hypothetical protein